MLKNLIRGLTRFSAYKTLRELPVTVWFDVHKDGNYNLLLKKKKKLSDKQKVKLLTLWETLVNEWIGAFGFSKDYERELKSEKALANMRADYIIHNKRNLLTLIAIEEEKIKMNSKEVEEPKELNLILAKMSKHYGFQLSSRDLMTDEYYSYLKNITNG